MQTIFQRVAAEAGEKLASKTDLADLKRLQGEWQKAADVIAGCGVDSAFNFWANEQRNAALAAKAGKLHEFRTHSREEMEEDFLRRGGAAREHQRQITAAALPIARKAADKFAEAAHEVAAKVEKAEVGIFADWGVPYSPSALVTSLRQLADRARGAIPRSEYSSASPASMVPFLTL